MNEWMNGYLAFVHGNIVAELSATSDLQIVPAHQSDRFPVVILLGRVEGQGVVAVVSDVLARHRRQQLQEADLVAVGLVGELESDFRDVREPDFAFGRLERHLGRDRRLRLDAGGLLGHVAVNQDGVLGTACVRIDPVLKENIPHSRLSSFRNGKNYT